MPLEIIVGLITGACWYKGLKYWYVPCIVFFIAINYIHLDMYRGENIRANRRNQKCNINHSVVFYSYNVFMVFICNVLQLEF